MEFVDEFNHLSICHLLERPLPNRLDLGRIAANAGRLSSKTLETRVRNIVRQAQRQHQPIPILAAAPAQAEIDMPILGFIALVGRSGVMIEMETVPLVRVRHGRPHNAAHMEQGSQHTDRHPLPFAFANAVKQPGRYRLGGHNAGIEAGHIRA